MTSLVDRHDAAKLVQRTLQRTGVGAATLIHQTAMVGDGVSTCRVWVYCLIGSAVQSPVDQAWCCNRRWEHTTAGIVTADALDTTTMVAAPWLRSCR